MNEILLCTGILTGVIGFVGLIVLREVNQTKLVIAAKLDAIMLKLIEIKNR